MKLKIAIPASALLLALSAAAWVTSPASPSPEQLVARAGAGAIRAIAFSGDHKATPETSSATEPLTLASSRPDSLAPSETEEGIAAIGRYRAVAFETARAKSVVVVADPENGALARSAAIVEFEKQCVDGAATDAAAPKARCTNSAIDVPDVPLVGCYLQQAASALLG